MPGGGLSREPLAAHLAGTVDEASATAAKLRFLPDHLEDGPLRPADRAVRERRQTIMNPHTPSRPTGGPPPIPTPEPADFHPPPLVPNAETLEALDQARRGELTYVGSVEELIALLDSDADEEAPAESAHSRPAPASG